MSNCSDVAVELDRCGLRTVDAAAVRRVRAALPAEQELAQAADVFGLLADRGRLRLLLGLVSVGELCVCDLAAAAGQTESAASHALRLLRAHRVVQVRRSGRRAYYRLADGHVRMLLELALTHAGHPAGPATEALLGTGP